VSKTWDEAQKKLAACSRDFSIDADECLSAHQFRSGRAKASRCKGRVIGNATPLPPHAAANNI
jgi:hypothetical protein